MADTDFVLTKGQEAALQLVLETAKARESEPTVTVVGGYAGTGKTTLMKIVADKIGPPLFLTPTGKAALRLKEATGFEASTIHRWMYRTEEDKRSGKMEFIRKPTDEIDRPQNKLIVVDEASMLSEPLWIDLKRTAWQLRCNIVLVGDPFQLPPVDPEARVPFSCLEDSFPAHHRVKLTEIVRQALDNPIIKASMHVRQGNIEAAMNLLPNLERGEAWKLTLDICKKTDGVVICHRNITRHKINAGVRAELGMPKDLTKDEPLLVLKNCYEANVYNGEVVPFAGWTWESGPVEVYDKYRDVTKETRFGTSTLNNTKIVLAHERIRGNMEELGFGAVAYEGLRTYHASKPSEPRQPSYKRDGKKGKRGPQQPFLDANFGYCLTAHRSQGSEWNRVLVIAEPTIRIKTEEGLRWLYTSITRAKDTVSLYWS